MGSRKSSAANYLADLRANRPTRPSGSRPLPTKSTSQIYQNENNEISALPQIGEPDRRTSTISHDRTSSGFPAFNSATSRNSIGRPLVQEPSGSVDGTGRKVSPTFSVSPPRQSSRRNYRESGARRIERQESISLRNALQELDIQDDEKRIYEAAQNEAADLVWKHRNPTAAEAEKMAPYHNPELSPQKNFADKLIKGVHSRSQSVNNVIPGRGNSESFTSRSALRSSSLTDEAPELSTANQNELNDNVASRFYDHDALSRARKPQRVSFAASTVSTAQPATSSRRRSSGQRKTSNGSSKGLFRNPDDQIYEEPQHPSNHRPQVRFADEPQPLQIRNENPRSPPEKTGTASMQSEKPFHRYDIYKNPPTQSRNAGYTTNTPTPPGSRENTPQMDAPMKEGREVRSDEIRAATSMRKSDRSPKLPTPTAVSDRPGRPIVSFDRSWTAKDSPPQVPDQSSDRNRPPSSLPITTKSAPAVPTINFPDPEPPSVSATELPASKQTLPIINVSEDGSSGPSFELKVDEPSTRPPIRPLPVPSKTSPLPAAKTSRLPWLTRNNHITPVHRQGTSTATCANCALPISGRILTASGAGKEGLKARFHPECFTCHHCSTSLEHIAFYPEPEEQRKSRLKTQAEELGLSTVEELGEAIEKELRFFCHLDFHEFFSPRCKSCKTPIEGQVIVAAGGEYHVGHFFCAECGDVWFNFMLSYNVSLLTISIALRFIYTFRRAQRLRVLCSLSYASNFGPLSWVQSQRSRRTHYYCSWRELA